MGRIAIIVLALYGILTVQARAATERPDPRVLECLSGTTGILRVNPDRVRFREDVTLSWTTTKPKGCERIEFEYEVQRPSSSRLSVSASGSQLFRPVGGETLQLVASYLDYQLVIAVANVSVDVPLEVFIDANDQGLVLVQALQTPKSMITVANGVEIDLTSFGTISIAPGVTLKGGRGRLDPGARLFTLQRTSDGMFFIGSEKDGVSISGLRLEGPETWAASGDEFSRGILIQSAKEVDIHNNEIYGWTSAAIEVQDKDGRIHATAPYTVRIYDNFIHHNQHVRANGYGVAPRHGAFVWIARNVFDWNRHAIAAGSQPGSGYYAEANLVLENGGLNWWIPFPGFWTYTHQFDAHGSERCLGEALAEHNCGPAGDSFYIYDNTFFFTHDNAIKLRGIPRVDGMFVDGNMFAHEWIGDAVTQTESGLVIGESNVRNNRVVIQEPFCDFDEDEINDRVMTTGATWWYASGGTMQWRYLNTHTEKLGGDLTMGYVNSDRICDITAGGVVYSRGTTPLPQISGTLPPPLPLMLR